LALDTTGNGRFLQAIGILFLHAMKGFMLKVLNMRDNVTDCSQIMRDCNKRLSIMNGCIYGYRTITMF